MALELRPIDYDADLELVHGWMQEPHVAPWWELAGAPERVHAYLDASQAAAHIAVWIAADDGRPVAYVETYRVLDDPLARYFEAGAGDRGFHLLVGPPELLGTGLARDLVRSVVARLLGEPEVTRVVCDPDVRNARMLGFCRALGGEKLATLEMPGRTAVLFAWNGVLPPH